MISKSGNHRVQVSFHGVSSMVPINRDYTYVVPSTLSIGAVNIPEIFRQNSDRYFRSVLSSVGNYASGIDYKHYDDPRCKCILCWTFRSGVRPEDYPTVKARLLCVEEQLRKENVHADMDYSLFTSLVYRSVQGIQPSMVDYLWTKMFKHRAPKAKEETFNLDRRIKRMLARSDIASLHANDLAGIPYPDDILSKMDRLQARIDEKYNKSKQAKIVSAMTKTELTRSHVLLLEERLPKQSYEPLQTLWKRMFKHDHLLRNFSKSRLNVDYAGFKDLKKADRLGVLKTRVARFEAKTAKTNTYAVDVLERGRLEKAYADFNDEFGVFLTTTEEKNFRNLFTSVNINSRVARDFKSARMSYKLDYLKQKSRKVIEEKWRPYDGKTAAEVKATVTQLVWNTIWWIPVLKKILKRVDLETRIQQFGFQSKFETRLRVKQAVREYIERIWRSMRDGTTDKAKFMTLRRKIYAERLKEYTDEYVDNKMYQYYVDLPDKTAVDRKWTNYILKVVVDFMGVYNLKTMYNPESTRARFVQQTQYGNIALSGPTERQVFLDKQYSGEGGYEEKARLDFYIREFPPRVRDIWNVVSWYQLRKKNQFLWRTTYDMSKGREEMIIKQREYKEEARVMAKVSDKTTAEMYLVFDIFGGWDIDDTKLDVFIGKNLPPNERKSFVHEMGSIKKMMRDARVKPILQSRMRYIRAAYKKIVFDKEIIKRAVMIQLRRENDLLRTFWSDDILNTRDRTWQMTNAQRAMQLEYYDYKDLEIEDRFPYNPDWVSYKYKHVHKWLAANAKVSVFCRYADVIDEVDMRGLVHYGFGDELVWNEEGYYMHPAGRVVRTDESGYWVRTQARTQVDPRYAITGLPEVWSDLSDKTEDLLTAWVEGIESTFVYVRLDTPMRVRKLTQTRQLEMVRVDISNVYDNALEYNIMRERAAAKQQEEKEREDELQQLEELERERRELIRGIVAADTSEEQQELEQRMREEENALLMFDESKSEERRRLFNEWLTPITNGFETPQAKLQYVTAKISECRAVGGEVKLQMFKDGRLQWLAETGIGDKRPYRERSPSDNMRTETEQRQFYQTLRILEQAETNERRKTSNKFTNEYQKFMYIYPRSGINNADIKMMVLEKIEDKTRAEKITVMAEYKKGMLAAIGREDQRWRKEKRSVSTALQRRRDQILGIIDSVTSGITQLESDPRLISEQNPEVSKYIMSGKLQRDADIQLKTPKLKYTQSMWESEVETSLQPLDQTTFTLLGDYVGKKSKVMYLIKKRSKPIKETEYQVDFKTKNAEGKPVYPTPDGATLKEQLKSFKPSRRSRFATRVRVAMGPGSWFKIDPLSDLMRRTNMSMEDRLLFALEVSKLAEETNPDRARDIRRRMRDWKESDGEEIRIVDDLVGEFRFSNGRSFRIARETDVPTHLRLNHVYFDTVRGKVGDKNVRRLVPYYVVSLYMKDGDYMRLKVRNRAHGTFLPRQVKHKNKLYGIEDYKGYACSICLSQEEFDSLTQREQMTPGVDRRILELPGPFLFKYHKILYSRAKRNLENILIDRVRNQIDRPLSEPVQIAGPDDMKAPYSDGMIRLGTTIDSLTVENGALCAGGRYFDMDGNQISPPTSSMQIEGNRLDVDGELAITFPYAVELNSIHSSTMLATYGQQRTETRFYTLGVVHIWVFREEFEQRLVAETNCSVLKWCKDILLVAERDVIRGYNSRCVQTLALRGHADVVTCLDVRNDRVVSGSLDNTLICWKNKGEALAVGSRVLVKDSNYRFGDVTSIEAGNACEVKLLKTPARPVRTATFECTPSAHLFTMHGHTYGIESVVWGRHIVSSSQDKTIIVWKGGSPLFRLDYTALKLVEPDMDTPYKRLASAIPKSQPQLVKAYLSKSAPKIALLAPNVVFYGVGSIMGKLDISKGECIPFADTVVNSVSELPPPPRVMLGPFRPFFNEDGSVYAPLDRPFESLKREAESEDVSEDMDEGSDSEWEDVTPGF